MYNKYLSYDEISFLISTQIKAQLKNRKKDTTCKKVSNNEAAKVLFDENAKKSTSLFNKAKTFINSKIV